jgi:hypothetical protein
MHKGVDALCPELDVGFRRACILAGIGNRYRQIEKPDGRLA